MRALRFPSALACLLAAACSSSPARSPDAGQWLLPDEGCAVFAPGELVQTPAAADWIATGDFDGDGHLDVAAVSHEGAGSLLLGHGDGTFSPGDAFPASIMDPASLVDAGVYYGSSIWTAASGALGQGLGDSLIVCDRYGAVDLLALGSDAGWQLMQRFNGELDRDAGLFLQPVAPIVAEFDGEGRGDVAVADLGPAGPGGGSIEVLTNRAGGFGVALFPLQVLPYALAVADFNGDGLPDLAVLDITRSVGILWNEGDGGFSELAPVGQPRHDGAQEGHLWALDIDGDGSPDLVTSGWNILFGDGHGSFTEVDLPITDGPLTSGSPILSQTLRTVADFNHDGFADLAGLVRVPPDNGYAVELWLGSRTRGSFSEWGATYPVAGSAIGGYETNWLVGALRPDAGPDAVYAEGGGSPMSPGVGGAIGILHDVCSVP